MFGSLGATEIILLFMLLLWIIPLIDTLKTEFKGNNKIVWILIILFLPIAGGILYLLVGRSQKFPKEG